MKRYDDEVGGIVTGWLVQILAILAVVGLIAYEIIAVVVSNVSADDSAREVARAARDTYRVEQSLEQAELTASEVALTREVDVASLTEDEGYLVVEVERQAPTLLVHRIGPIAEWSTTSASSRVQWAP